MRRKRPPLGRSELLSWLNGYLGLDAPTYLHLKLKRIEDGKNGAVSALILDSVLFGLRKKRRVPLHRVKWCARSEYDIMSNYRLVQDALRATGSMKEIPTAALLKGNFRLVFDWLTWLRRFVSATLGARDGVELTLPPLGYDMHDNRSLCIGVPPPSSTLKAVTKLKSKRKMHAVQESVSLEEGTSGGDSKKYTQLQQEISGRNSQREVQTNLRNDAHTPAKVLEEIHTLESRLQSTSAAVRPQLAAATRDRIKRAHSILNAADERCQGACLVSKRDQDCENDDSQHEREAKAPQLQRIWKEQMPWNSKEFRAKERRHIDDREQGVLARLALREQVMMMTFENNISD